MEIDAVLVVFVALIIGGIFAVHGYVSTQRVRYRPSAELAQSVRLLERVLAGDDVAPMLPKHTRDEIEAFIAHYYKEINS